MNNLKKQSYSQLKQTRDLMLNAKVFSIDEEDRETFQKVIEGLEKRMYRKVRIAVIAISLLVLLSMFPGCNTIEGARMDVHQWTETPAHHK